MLYSGIDLHKHSLFIHTVGENGSLVRGETSLGVMPPAIQAQPASLSASYNLEPRDTR